MRYRPRVASKSGGVNIDLVSGLKGMTVDDEGMLNWKATSKPGRAVAILKITDGSGQERFHTVAIDVAASAPPASESTEAVPDKDQIESEMRTWKDATGRFSVDATLIRRDDEFLYLRRADGSEAKVRIQNLSQEDQAFVNGQQD